MKALHEELRSSRTSILLGVDSDFQENLPSSPAWNLEEHLTASMCEQ